MVNNKNKKPVTKKRVAEQKQVIDRYARALQALAIIAVIAIYVIRSVYPDTDIPVWVPGGLLGVAIGLSPEQIVKLLTNIARAFMDSKR